MGLLECRLVSSTALTLEPCGPSVSSSVSSDGSVVASIGGCALTPAFTVLSCGGHGMQSMLVLFICCDLVCLSLSLVWGHLNWLHSKVDVCVHFVCAPAGVLRHVFAEDGDRLPCDSWRPGAPLL